MKQALRTFAVTIFLLTVSMWGQQWTNWSGTSNNFNITYRYRLFPNSKSCDIAYRDQNQGDGNTTFDAAVDYETTPDPNYPSPNKDPNNTNPHGPDPRNARVTKTDSEHIVTTTNHTGSAQIPNCFAITEVRVSFVQRH